MDAGFTDAQQRYLAGYALGTDIARTVLQLPVLSGTLRGDPATGSAAEIRFTPQGPVIQRLAGPQGPDADVVQARQMLARSGKTLSQEEQIKQRLHPADGWHELLSGHRAGGSFTADQQFRAQHHGLFAEPSTGGKPTFMARTRTVGGVLSTWQLRGIASLTEEHGDATLQITTRANLQIRQVPAARAFPLLERLHDLKLADYGSGGDAVRNLTCSPISDLDPTALINVLPHVRRLDRYLNQSRALWGVPGKVNVALDDGGAFPGWPLWNDICLRAVRVSAEGDIGFATFIGGLTREQTQASDMNLVVAPESVPELVAAILRVYIQQGERGDRRRRRLRHLLDQIGFDTFRQSILQNLDPRAIVPPSHRDRAAAPSELKHLGAHLQKQSGLYYVGVEIPLGLLSTAHAYLLCNVADRLGTGEVRLTPRQTVIIPNVRESDLNAACGLIASGGLTWAPPHARAGLLTCTGQPGCRFACGATQQQGWAIAQQLSSHPLFRDSVSAPDWTLHVSGCEMGCSQPFAADIGLISRSEANPAYQDTVYHIYVPALAASSDGKPRCLADAVPFTAVSGRLAKLLDRYQSQRSDAESLRAWIARHELSDLRRWI